MGDLVDGALNKVGSEETGTMRSRVRMVHSTANTIRLDAVKKAGSEKAKKIEEASIIGALIEVSGLQDLLAIFGFKLKNTETQGGGGQEDRVIYRLQCTIKILIS